ncbi:MAG: chaperone NapD [Bryobacterales bacterium]|nr:chaperone NapD [Bryobacterales bacterium]
MGAVVDQFTQSKYSFCKRRRSDSILAICVPGFCAQSHRIRFAVDAQWIQQPEGGRVAIQSFLVYTKPGHRADVAAALAAMPGMEATAADNEDLVILVTESEGKAATQSLERALEALEGVDGFALVAGYSEEAIRAAELESVEDAG